MLPLYHRSIILFRKSCLLCKRNFKKIVMTGLRIQATTLNMDNEKMQAGFPIPLFKQFEEIREPPAMPVPDLKPNEKVVTKFINLSGNESNIFLLSVVICSILGFFVPSKSAFAVVLAYIVYLYLYTDNTGRPLYNLFLLFGGTYCLATLVNLVEISYSCLQIALVITFIDSFFRLQKTQEITTVEYKPEEQPNKRGNTIMSRLMDAFDF